MFDLNSLKHDVFVIVSSIVFTVKINKTLTRIIFLNKEKKILGPCRGYQNTLNETIVE